MIPDSQPLISVTSLANSPSEPYLIVRRHGLYHLLDLIAREVEDLLCPDFMLQHRNELYTPLFEFEVKKGEKSWNIIKTQQQFANLETVASNYGTFPPIPIDIDEQLSYKQLEHLLQFYEILLNEYAKKNELLNDRKVKEFFYIVECEDGSDGTNIDVYYQTWLLKRAGGRHAQSNWKRIKDFLSRWQPKYITITKDGLYYCDTNLNVIKQTVLFSSDFKLVYGKESTGEEYGVIVSSSQIVLHMVAEDIFTMSIFVYFLKIAMHGNTNLTVNHYGSFAKGREDCQSQFLIDGSKYFSRLHECLIKAKKEVFITGWSISPYFNLKRPDPNGETRLDQVLTQLAERGVKVNILIYNAPPMALSIDSKFTETYLSSLHKNIKVISHPNYVLIPFLWSHHEKLVIIDKETAFLGGLDIAYGRMDDHEHHISQQNSKLTWPGVDYCNYRLTDILNPRQHEMCTINRLNNPRMPWHDVAVMLKGASIQDLSRHFVEYWNYASEQLSLSDRQLLFFVGYKSQDKAQAKQHWKNKASEAKIKESEEIISSVPPREIFSHSYEQKQWKSTFVVASQDLDFQTNFLKSNSSMILCDKGDHEQQIEFYVKYLDDEQFPSNEAVLKEADDDSKRETIKERAIEKLSEVLHSIKPRQLLTKCKEVINISNWHMPALWKFHSSDKQEEQQKEIHQILRSADLWSLGLEQPECSIYMAYYDLIQNAKEFIYIENQFFISIENCICSCIVERIRRAHENHERFKVMIVLPALPGFEGTPDDQNSVVFRIQLQHVYATVRQLFNQLDSIKQIQNYLQVYSLRAHGIMNSRPQTEIIYVHSKLMIVDDEKILIGSANINDRSLKGARDSELAVLIKAQDVCEISLEHGEKRQICKSAFQLRKSLYSQHFGTTEEEAQDYLNEEVWLQISEQSSKNMDIYREIFGCYPDNHMKSFPAMHYIKSKADLNKYELLSILIKGHAIVFQRDFLCQEFLLPSMGKKQYYVPAVNFT